MGAILSRTQEPLGEEPQDPPVSQRPIAEIHESEDEDAEARRLGHEHELESLKAELATKRAQRREALEALRQELTREREERLRLEALIQEEGGSRAEVEGLERQVKALKDVAQIGGEMLKIRELQVNELKEKLRSIEETGMAYEKEVDNMRKLKDLYEERSRATAISHQMELEKEKTKLEIAEKKREIAEDKNKELTEVNNELQERITSLDSTIDKNNAEISELKVQVAGYKEELYNANSQIAIVNNLFSQLLSDSENLDRVTRVLQEHHDLVNHLTEKGNINEVASVLMKVADRDRVLTDEEQDIASNLNKVWRLLVELLGYHSKQTTGETTMPDSCYKSVDTPTGPKLVISVSQTFLRLKDLILEKNSLVKEVGRLKDLNTHLEARLSAQETRLVEVAEELHKTWGVVNKLKSQHKAIHTHEQVLRYELKHKRLMLNELKQQLEECREMWQMARVKNDKTEKDWEELRKEFADRKQQISSAESGYEESPGDSQDEEDSRKLSDDESDMQDLLPLNLPKCLELRLHDSEISTPDRSFTPDMQVPDMLPEENKENPECTKANDPVINLIKAETTNEEPPGLDNRVGNLPERLPDETCVINQTRTPDNDPPAEVSCANILPASLDNLEIEIEPTVKMLPWDTPEETYQESLLFPNNAVISEMEQLLLETTEELLINYNQAIVEPNSQASRLSMCNIAKTEPTVIVCNTSLPLTSEEILARREARLRRLEEQCMHLYNKVSNTNRRSDMITSKLVELHEQYGDSTGESASAEGSQTQKDHSLLQPVEASEWSGNSNELLIGNETEEEPEEQTSDLIDGRTSR